MSFVSASTGNADDLTTPNHQLAWETVPNAVFDELVARIIVDPLGGLDELDNVLIRREADGSTLLHVIAGWANCQDLVARLIQAGIPPDTKDNSGWTPLLEAAQEGQIAICKVLLANGATPDLAVDDVTPLRAAAEVGNEIVTQWLLEQPGTWSGTWDPKFFEFLLAKTPGSAPAYLDRFASVLNHSKRGCVAVKYSCLRSIYGEPHVPVDETALALVVKCANARDILSHRVLKYVMRVKWRSFARAKFRREFAAYMVLLSSYFIPTIWADPNWIQLTSTFDYWVASFRGVSWICSLYLLVRVEWNEFRGDSARSYFSSFWNWLNIITYVATMLSIPVEFNESLAEQRNSILALITVSLWVNLLQFLQVSTESGLLIAMMTHMVKDVYRFVLLYTVFIFGYSGAFYILLRGSTGFDNFTNSFITVFLMLFGAIDYSVFSDKSIHGWRWHMGNFLLMSHLVGVVIVLLNILIAMMATTYSDVWEAAEAEALQSHAQAILRKEKSLQQSERTKKFYELLTPEGSNLRKFVKPSSDVTQVEAGKSDVGSTRSIAKRQIREGILDKILSLPLATDASSVVTRALSRSTSVRSTKAAVHPDEGPSSLPHSVQFEELDQDSVTTQKRSESRKLRPAALIGNLIDAPKLTAIEESLFLKSAFDRDDQGPDAENVLGILEDGIRYEVPLNKSAEEQNQVELKALRAQVEQLTQSVEALGAIVRESGRGAGSLRQRGPSAFHPRAFEVLRSPRVAHSTQDPP